MQRLINRSLCTAIACAASLLVVSAPASAHGDRGRDGEHRNGHGVVRAALPPGALAGAPCSQNHAATEGVADQHAAVLSGAGDRGGVDPREQSCQLRLAG